MGSPKADYPAPTIVAQTATTGLQPNVLDTSPFFMPGYPPVIEIYISATATVLVMGGMSLSGANPPVVQYSIDVSGGGITSSQFYDLIVGIPFWQFNVTANSGTVTIIAGRCASAPGTLATPSIVRMTTNATQGL